MESEKLGTCDERKVRHTWDEVTGEVPHRLSGMCRNWREQPQGEATREFDPLARYTKCPRCGHYPWKFGTFPATPDSCGFHQCGCKHECHVQTEGGEKPQVCHNPNHFHTDSSPSEHEIGSSCMAEPASPSVPAGTLEKYFVDKTYDGWGIFYNEPNAPETGRACIGGSADEHIARLRCQILNGHIADVLDAVGFAKTQERLTGRCLCVGAWKSGCPVHDNSPATAGTASRYNEWLIDWLKQDPTRKDTLNSERAEAYADQRVRPLQISLAKLYAAIGPMDELDTVDDAVARVEKLRQERDALGREMLERIRATVKARSEGRNEGGDIEVMQAIDRIEREARECSEELHKKLTHTVTALDVVPVNVEGKIVWKNLRAERAEQERDELLVALGCTLGGVPSALEVIEAKNQALEDGERAEKALQEQKALLQEIWDMISRDVESPFRPTMNLATVMAWVEKAAASLKSSKGAK